mmetsp:Transcript_26420/g.29428  ORF Transcript_26420/g.29428 Transcript_26420/m.29428 type:complete len:356 (-) Transcript_26420:73-1140(-)|eukprot:CAMPEP_0168510714 /NCGR_PEP_ID=MMETSP0405-20121227/1638_1 /TAXON_ID=498012 /ORGANISM="Trichosphaerium sp, Strain Am-I-7 wt" /LENGTH=355 /DNA_ID=CAMNT_0008528621 /DNA_START=1451 /DNA_END=2518 /DNA_ORIENTATION=-
MGNCLGGESDKETVRVNKVISRMLHDDRRKLENEVKLLLLGAGESGKSTIAKQMKIIHNEGFTEEERVSYKSVIYNNTFLAMKTMIQAAHDLGISIKAKANRKIAAKFVDEDTGYFHGDITPEIAVDIKALWSDPGIQKTFKRSAEYQLTDSAHYYIESVDRLSDEGYVPTEQDVLRSRAKTTGIIETDFTVEKTKFRMVDVGGQRSERKKWMHCFGDVTAVIFCVALSEYDLKLYEDNETNRMHESLRLFKEICNSKWFVDTSMILFLNKKDLFEEKIKHVPLTECFKDYPGPQEFEACSNHIRDKFVQQNENDKKQVYPHLTCATDTNHVKLVFNAVKDIILHKALDESGLGL